MLHNLITVGEQALVLFLLLCVGFVCARVGLISQAAVPNLTNLILFIVVPCSLLSAFQLDLTAALLRDFFVSVAVAVLTYISSFGIAHLIFRRRETEERRIFALSATVTNCNFMGFPLQTALLGSQGIFYGSAFAAVSPLFMFTVGVSYLQGGLKKGAWKQVALNPGIIGVLLGLLLFFTGIRLPRTLNLVVSNIAAMNVPLPMIVVGCQLAQADLRHLLREKTHWFSAALRLLILPLLCVFAMYLCGVRGNILIASAIAAAAPPGTIVSMMAAKYDCKPQLAAEMMSFQTILSVVTMPLIVGLAQTVSKL